MVCEALESDTTTCAGIAKHNVRYIATYNKYTGSRYNSQTIITNIQLIGL